MHHLNRKIIQEEYKSKDKYQYNQFRTWDLMNLKQACLNSLRASKMEKKQTIHFKPVHKTGSSEEPESKQELNETNFATQNERKVNEICQEQGYLPIEDLGKLPDGSTSL